MGTGGDKLLILVGLLAAWMGAQPPSLHMEPLLAGPSLSGRLDSIFRDSLRARGVDLYPLDSLARLQSRGEWPTGEKTTSNLAKLKALTKKERIGWVRVDMPNPEFRRFKWFPLWAHREWVLRGEIFRSTEEAPEVERFSIRRELSLGFVGTWDGDQFPPSSSDVRAALEILAPDVATRVAAFLTAAPGTSPNP